MRWYNEPRAHEGLIYATFGFTSQQKRLDGEGNIKINKERGIYIRHYRQTLGGNEHLITHQHNDRRIKTKLHSHIKPGD